MLASVNVVIISRLSRSSLNFPELIDDLFWRIDSSGHIPPPPPRLLRPLMNRGSRNDRRGELLAMTEAELVHIEAEI